MLGQVDDWLGIKFIPASLDATLAELAWQAASAGRHTSVQAEAARAGPDERGRDSGHR